VENNLASEMKFEAQIMHDETFGLAPGIGQSRIAPLRAVMKPEVASQRAIEFLTQLPLLKAMQAERQ